MGVNRVFWGENYGAGLGVPAGAAAAPGGGGIGGRGARSRQILAFFYRYPSKKNILFRKIRVLRKTLNSFLLKNIKFKSKPACLLAFKVFYMLF